MTENDGRYRAAEDEPMRLDEVLEPFDGSAPTRRAVFPDGYAQPPAYHGPVYNGLAEEAPSDDPGLYGDTAQSEAYGTDDPYAPADAYGEPPYEDDPYLEAEDGDPVYDDELYDGEVYSDYHEELDHENRVRTAVGVFDTVSTLVGVVVILVLAAMLFSLLSWLQADVTHSLTLLQSGLK